MDSGSADCLWAQLIEKAYAVSGIHTNGGYPKTDETKSATFDRISGGDPVSMMQTLLGPEVKKSITYTPGSFDNNEKMKDFIKKSLDTGKVITLCSKEDPDRKGEFPGKLPHNGFNAGHAYSAVSYNDKYLFVRDPWGKDGIVHKDDFTPEKEGSLIKRDKTLPEGIHAIPWEAMPKINRYFHGFDVHEIQNKTREVNLTDVKKNFKTVVDDLAGKLNKTDSFIKRCFYNSKEFNKFATALNDLNNSLDKKSISMDELKEKFLEVKKTAEAYENRTAPKNRGKNFNLRKNIAATAKQFNAMFRDYGKEMSVEESMRKVYVDNVAGKFAEYMRGHNKPDATKDEILNSPSFKKFVNNSSLAELSDGALKMTSENINTMIEHKIEEAQIVRVNQAMEI